MIYIEERGKGTKGQRFKGTEGQRGKGTKVQRGRGAKGQRFKGTKDQGPEIGNHGPKTKDYIDQRRFLSVFSLRFVVSRKW